MNIPVMICRPTLEKSQQKDVCSINGTVDLCAVEFLQVVVSIHHPQGVVDEQGIVVLPEVDGALCERPVVLTHP